MSEIRSDERTNPDYWKNRIETEGLETVEDILSNDRSWPGNEIDNARQKAISSYRFDRFFSKVKAMITISK